MTFDQFKASAKGKRIGAILDDHDQQVRMECLSEFDMPAAQAVGAAILAEVGNLDDTERQHVVV